MKHCRISITEAQRQLIEYITQHADDFELVGMFRDHLEPEAVLIRREHGDNLVQIPDYSVPRRRNFHTYMGHIIHRNDKPGHRLRWSCLGIGASNTLAGMKSLIRRNHKRKDIAYKQ